MKPSAASFMLVSVDDYLAGEIDSPRKREYVEGRIYVRAETTNLHNRISGNVLGFLHGRLRAKRCRPFNSDTKLRVRMTSHVRFYYPDVSVVCHENDPDDSYQDEPAVVAEVLSRKTRRTDEGEKKDAYLTIPSLSVYLLIDQEMAAVVAHRRTDQGFVREVYVDMDDIIPLPEVDAELPLAEIYEGVAFSPEPDEDA